MKLKWAIGFEQRSDLPSSINRTRLRVLHLVVRVQTALGSGKCSIQPLRAVRRLAPVQSIVSVLIMMCIILQRIQPHRCSHTAAQAHTTASIESSQHAPKHNRLKRRKGRPKRGRRAVPCGASFRRSSFKPRREGTYHQSVARSRCIDVNTVPVTCQKSFDATTKHFARPPLARADTPVTMPLQAAGNEGHRIGGDWHMLCAFCPRSHHG